MNSEPGCKEDNSGDITWMLVSTLLVLTMMPALAFFEAGLLRTKNSLSILTQVFAGLTVLCVMWLVVGYSLTFGPSHNRLIGGFSKVFLHNVSAKDCGPHAPAIPEILFCLFQMMFAIIAPLLVTGAFAERMRFKAVLAFCVLWEVLIYYPVAQAVWNIDGWLNHMGVIDFAGGLVLHTTAGVSALVCAVYLGPRLGFETHGGAVLPSNVPLAAIGAALLWAGWFGFNGGSAFEAGFVALGAVVATQAAACCSAFAWLFLSWCDGKFWSVARWEIGKPSLVAVMNGAIAGLAGVTPASGFITPSASIILGFLLGIVSFYAAHALKHNLKIDDALEVSVVHGLTGLMGSIFNGFAASSEMNPGLPRSHNGIIYSPHSSYLLRVQLLAALVIAAYTAVLTYAILKFLSWAFGTVRVAMDSELIGLDWTEHSEIAYHSLWVAKPSNKRLAQQAGLRSRPAVSSGPHEMTQVTEYPPPSDLTTGLIGADHGTGVAPSVPHHGSDGHESDASSDGPPSWFFTH